MSEIAELLKGVGEVKSFITERYEKEVPILHEEWKRLAGKLETAQKEFQDYRRAQVARITDGRMNVASGRLAGFDLLDIRILEEVLRWQYRTLEPSQLTEIPLMKILNDSRTQVRQAIGPDTILAWQEGGVKRRTAGFYRGISREAVSKFEGEVMGWTRNMITMYQRALDSATTGAGRELVPTIEAAELWMDVNLDTLVLPALEQTQMPTNPFDIPRQFGDINWYPGTENVQTTTTDPTTAKATLTAYALRGGVPFSDELEEDSIVALVPELRRGMTRNAAEVIDDVILNADTRTLNGINSDGATISTATAGKAHFLLGFDGMIKLPLADNTANTTNKNAVVDADIYNRILAAMGKYGVPRRRGEVVYVADVNTATRSLAITQFETADVAGGFERATLSTGEIISVFGKPLIQSAQMRLAQTSGLVANTSTDNTTGRILCFNVSQWRVGFRRQVTLEAQREAGKGQTTLYISFRIALTQFASSRGTAKHTALARNLTGVA